MFDSIIKDIRYELARGNTITKLILVNIGVFIVFLLTRVISMAVTGGDESLYGQILSWFALSGDFHKLVMHPWTIITYSLVHQSIWQILFNMLLLYWFGQIAGDLVGDRRIFPIYLYGAIVGGLIAVISGSLLPTFHGSNFLILGAMAPVMAIIVAAATLAPDYSMRLILIGPVKIKFIVLVIVLFLFAGISTNFAAGSSYAGLGGALTGYLFIMALRSGYDPSLLFRKPGRISTRIKRQSNKKSKIISIFDTVKKHETELRDNHPDHAAQRLDIILEKIKKSGRSSLSQDELDFLDKISKS